MTPDVIDLQRQDAGGPRPVVSVVIPVHKEEATLDPLYERLERVLEELAQLHEVIFVDDGSWDRSLDGLRHLPEKHEAVRVTQLDRNYGQHAAIIAGLDHARGDVISR